MLFVKWLGGGILWATGILGRSFVRAILLSFFESSSPPYSYFQLFFFLLGDGLVNRVFLSALKRFSPLWDLCIFISSPTYTFFFVKNYVNETDFLGLYLSISPFIFTVTLEVILEFSLSIFFLFKESSKGLLKKESSYILV